MKNIVLMALAGISLAFTVKTTPETDQVVYWPEMPLESTFIDASEVADKKSIYVTIVAGLLVVAFVAPMLQFFYYTGGD